ncbi:unnamed protein product (macronuclear) [Paramecium tetraurelia]|uniref:Uncharacterized protein n=1 Tax=Paramecium tetraurelia TaxID=5888 RepID=A0EH90_PARTE|nr:uncharacterized protein GSPATT00027005001 [Paramecium tetraurelia]CAK94681.1 unnamed protein product [Paramecium tetraurelia]|eukprot:XP_001462054.1 hypothetical protein (macronuclear) [Paramecium tetraurelia strain d4-2]
MNDQKRLEEIGIQRKELILKKTKIQLQYNEKEQKIAYIKDGEILRQCAEQYIRELLNNSIQSPQKIINLEHLKHLDWEFGLKKDQKELWFAKWKGHQLLVGGCFNENNQKVGKWIELSEYFWDLCRMTHQGFYNNGIKVGQWNTKVDEKIMQKLFGLVSGGGLFDDLGQKQGKWIEMHQNFYNGQEVKHEGEYKDGKEFGKWDTFFKNKIIGGGQYDNDGLKFGNWIELSDNFIEYYILFPLGMVKCHTKENISKVRRMEDGIRMTKRNQCIIEDINISGGGLYNQDGLKDGNWIDLHDDYWQFCQVTYLGEYSNGIKQKQWKSNYYQSNVQQLQKILSGGGIYDEFGQKQGRWVDLHDNFHNGCQVTLVGEYQNNKKVGQWDAMYMEQNLKDVRKIGGGIYDENETKVGFWMDLHEYFCDTQYIIISGQYKNGIKVGKVEIEFKKQYENEQKKIGGGIIDENGLKDGQWIELSDTFCFFQFDTIINQYKNGRKIKQDGKS